MRNMEELKEMLCDELDKIVDKGTVSMSDLEIVHKLTDTIKNIGKIEMQEEQGYSSDGGWNASGTYSQPGGRSYGRYGDGGSYRSGGRHYVRGHYSYGDDMAERLERMMNEGSMSAEDRNALRRAMEIVRR